MVDALSPEDELGFDSSSPRPTSLTGSRPAHLKLHRDSRRRTCSAPRKTQSRYPRPSNSASPRASKDLSPTCVLDQRLRDLQGGSSPVLSKQETHQLGIVQGFRSVANHSSPGFQGAVPSRCLRLGWISSVWRRGWVKNGNCTHGPPSWLLNRDGPLKIPAKQRQDFYSLPRLGVN